MKNNMLAMFLDGFLDAVAKSEEKNPKLEVDNRELGILVGDLLDIIGNRKKEIEPKSELEKIIFQNIYDEAKNINYSNQKKKNIYEIEPNLSYIKNSNYSINSPIDKEKYISNKKKKNDDLSIYQGIIEEKIKEKREKKPELEIPSFNVFPFSIDENALFELQLFIQTLNDFSPLAKSGIISTNKVFETYDKETQKPIIIKTHQNQRKAKTEVAAQRILNSNHSTAAVTSGLYQITKPIEWNGVYLTSQYKLPVNQIPQTAENEYTKIKSHLRTLALLHSKGTEAFEANQNVLDELELQIEEYSYKTTFSSELNSVKEKILFERIKALENTGLKKISQDVLINYMQLYKELEQDLSNRSTKKVIIHSDAKPDNLIYNPLTNESYLIDLEHIRWGDITTDISRVLIQSQIPIEKWGELVDYYQSNFIQRGSIQTYDITLKDDVYKAAILTGVKEIRGLMSRDAKLKEINEMQYLMHRVNEVVNYINR